MKKSTSLLIIFLLLSNFSVFGQTGNWINSANTDWFTNSPSKTYTLSSAEQFAGLSKLVNEGHHFKDTTFTLANNVTIDLKAHYWTPIGSQEEKPFRGTLDGKNNKITNIYIGQDIKYQSTGLFGYVGDGAKIINLSMEGGEIAGLKNESTRNFPLYTGGLIGAIIGSSGPDSVVIRNCHNHTAIKGGFDYSQNHDGSDIGGLVGFASGNLIIDFCSNGASISVDGVKDIAGLRIGGLIGVVSGHFIISGCRNTGDISSSYSTDTYMGGLVGTVETDNINTCHVTSSYSKGAVVVKDGLSSGECGGLIGSINDYSYSTTKGGVFMLDNCFSDISFNVKYLTGGFLVGNISMVYLEKVVVKDCYATGKNTGEDLNSYLRNFIRLNGPDVINDKSSYTISNCLYVVDDLTGKTIVPFNDILSSWNANIISENNYVFVNGTGVNDDKKYGEDWNGHMNEAPVSTWDKAIWEIDLSNKNLPGLKKYTDSRNIPNPLYNQPSGYNSVILPKYTGVDISESGIFKIKNGKSYVFSVSTNGNVGIADISVKTADGTNIPVYIPVNSKEAWYIVDNITKDVEIIIEGEGINYEPDGTWSDYANTNWFTKNKKEYTLSTVEEFAGLAKLVNEGHHFADTTFILSNDLNLRFHYWDPIANTQNTGFRGIFNGNNKKIKNLYTTTKELVTGLFGYLDTGAQIRDLTVERGKVSNISNKIKLLYAGAIVGSAKGNILIKNCHNLEVEVIGDTDTRNGAESYVGGIIGQVSGTIIIDSCTNTGKVSAYYHDFSPGFMLGGIVGLIKGHFDISHCGNSGVISMPEHTKSLGGIIGEVIISDNNGTSKLTSCFNHSSLWVSSNPDFGGIVGKITNGFYPTSEGTGEFIMKNCYYSYNSSSRLSVGLIGTINLLMKSVIIENNYAKIKLDYSMNEENSAGLIRNVVNNGKNTSVKISNNLAVIEGNFLISPRLIKDTTGIVTLSNNYAYAALNGDPSEDDGTGLSGLNWEGKMDKGPIDKWDESYWTIDKSNKNMPVLKGVINQTNIPNPLYGSSLVFYKVTLPEVEGISMNYLSGTYNIIKGNDFSFQISALPNADISKMTVETDDGIPVPLVNSYYTLRNINKDIRIVIKNVIYSGISNESIEFVNKVWAVNNYLYINTEKSQALMIYGITGQLYKQQIIPAGDTVLPISAGIYIVRVGKETHKVIVR